MIGRFVLDDRAKWQPLKEIVHFLEHTVRIFDVLSKTPLALQSEAEEFIHLSILVVSSQQEDLLRVLELESKQQTQNLQTLRSAVDVVT